MSDKSFMYGGTVGRLRCIGGTKARQSAHSIDLSHNPAICWRVVEAPVFTRELTDTIETVKPAISSEAGVSVLPVTSVSREVENGMVAAVPIDMPELPRPIGFIHRLR